MNLVYTQGGQAGGVRWVVGEGGEPKVGSSIHLTGKAANVCPLKCTNSQYYGINKLSTEYWKS